MRDWTGFYRVVAPELLKIGPYQGGHGCLVIPFSRGVCGACARSGQVQNVPDVDAFPGHIACASSTRSELVLPVWNGAGRLLGVLDLDSDTPAAFTAADEDWSGAAAGRGVPGGRMMRGSCLCGGVEFEARPDPHGGRLPLHAMPQAIGAFLGRRPVPIWSGFG